MFDITKQARDFSSLYISDRPTKEWLSSHNWRKRQTRNGLSVYVFARPNKYGDFYNFGAVWFEGQFRPIFTRGTHPDSGDASNDVVIYHFPPDEASWEVYLNNADRQYKPYRENDLV